MTRRDEFDDWPDPPEPDPETEQRDELEANGYFDPEDGRP